MKIYHRLTGLILLLLLNGVIASAQFVLTPNNIIAPDEDVSDLRFVSFSVSKFDRIYTIDVENNEIYLRDRTGKVIKTAGGYGWEEGLFDEPTDISTGDDLNYYITDYNNQRIQRFDKQLNYIGMFEGNSAGNEFYPLAVGISRFKKLFILDDEKEKILCFNSSRELVNEFGGVEQEEYNIENPVDMEIDKEGNVVVLEKNRILNFDRMGTGRSRYNLDDSITAQSVTKIQDNYIVTTKEDDKIYIYNSRNNIFQSVLIEEIKNEEEISETTLDNRYFYILTTRGRILIYDKSALLQLFKKENLSR